MSKRTPASHLERKVSALETALADMRGRVLALEQHAPPSGGDSSTATRLAAIETALEALRTTVTQEAAQLMNRIDTITALLTQVNDATNQVATKVDTQIAEIRDLRAQIAAGTNVTDAQLAAIETNLTAERDRLNAIAATPEDPIPAPTPDPAPVPEV